jgi:peptide/nickel transport system permease protein
MSGASLSSALRVTATGRLAALLVPPTVALAFAVIALVIAWSLAPGLFTNQDPVYGVPADKLLGPSAAHWFGTDHLGRDLYARVVHGTASSVTSALIAVVIGVAVGGLIRRLDSFLGG